MTTECFRPYRPLCYGIDDAVTNRLNVENHAASLLSVRQRRRKWLVWNSTHRTRIVGWYFRVPLHTYTLRRDHSAVLLFWCVSDSEQET